MCYVFYYRDHRREKGSRFNQMVICSRCGRYGRYEVYMTYTALSLFFIPCFKWNKEYFVRMSCCGTVYRLDPEVGRRIARGEDLEIQPADLQPVQAGPYDPYGQNGWGSREKRCRTAATRRRETLRSARNAGTDFRWGSVLSKIYIYRQPADVL